MMNNPKERTVTIIPARKKADPTLPGVPRTRVAAYCRVSTCHDNQRNSYQTQIAYYTELITNTPGWELVGIFADEGLSGTQLLRRTEMNRLLAKCREGGIDLILCKSISRFARNTVDLLDIVRDLKALGIGVKFEKENIDTLQVDSEFIISLYASFAQAESESISQNVLWGIRKKFAEGNVRYNLQNTLGYRMSDAGLPLIVEEEARIVREIFTAFAEGISMKAIARDLTQRGIPRRNGSTVWSRGNVLTILRSEKYAGDAILQKSYTLDCLTHRRAVNYGQRPKYYIQNAHEAIVDRQTYDRVRLELARRSLNARRRLPEKGTYRTKYLLNELLFCPICGANYKRTIWKLRGQSVGVWRCGTRLELDKSKCPASPSIHEDKLHSALIRAVNKALAESAELIHQVEAELIRLQQEAVNAAENDREELKRRICDDLALIEYLRDEDHTAPLSHFDQQAVRKLVERIDVCDKTSIKVHFRGGTEETVPAE